MDQSLLILGNTCQILWIYFKIRLILINHRYFKTPLCREENKACFKVLPSFKNLFFLLFYTEMFTRQKENMVKIALVLQSGDLGSYLRLIRYVTLDRLSNFCASQFHCL